jgi:phosphomannomutase
MRPDSPAINPEIVRSYDIRGRVGEQLTLQDARALGLAVATAAHRRRLQRIAVSRDGRSSSPELENAVIEGLLAGGVHVYPTGLGPTPQLYYAVRAAGLHGGIMVTGSHNPPDQNGFKLLLEGEPIFGAALRDLVAIVPVPRDGGTVRQPILQASNGPRVGAACIAESYAKYLAQCAGDTSALHVVWDCGNGAVGAIIAELTDQLPGCHVLLNSRVDGRFPAHHPDPALEENLRQLQSEVRARNADVGIAFDGDGDRIGVVDATGAVIWPDQLLLFLAKDVLEAHCGATIVGDVKSSKVLFEGVHRLGGRAVMAPSGYVLVRQAMLRENAQLAGEMSGHIVFSDCWHGTDDALYAAMRLLRALGRDNTSMAAFRSSLPVTLATPELRVPCAERRKSYVMREVAARVAKTDVELDTTDGLRVTTAQGWWLLRTSGTEEKLTARCEAADEAGLECLKKELVSQLRQSGIEIDDTGVSATP